MVSSPITSPGRHIYDATPPACGLDKGEGPGDETQQSADEAGQHAADDLNWRAQRASDAGPWLDHEVAVGVCLRVGPHGNARGGDDRTPAGPAALAAFPLLASVF